MFLVELKSIEASYRAHDLDQDPDGSEAEQQCLKEQVVWVARTPVQPQGAHDGGSHGHPGTEQNGRQHRQRGQPFGEKPVTTRRAGGGGRDETRRSG